MYPVSRIVLKISVRRISRELVTACEFSLFPLRLLGARFGNFPALIVLSFVSMLKTIDVSLCHSYVILFVFFRTIIGNSRTRKLREV